MNDQTPNRRDWKLTPRAVKIAELKRMARLGFSTRQMADYFDGATKNAVIGLCHRQGIKLAANQQPMTTPKSRLPKQAVVYSEPSAPRPATGKRFADTTANDCKWPLWDVMPGCVEQAMCCGEETVPGRSYCAVHQAQSVGPGTPSERAACRELERHYLRETRNQLRAEEKSA